MDIFSLQRSMHNFYSIRVVGSVIIPHNTPKNIITTFTINFKGFNV